MVSFKRKGEELLTGNEYEVVLLAAVGCTDAQIAQLLGAGKSTVQRWLHRAGEELGGVNNRCQLVYIALEQGQLRRKAWLNTWTEAYDTPFTPQRPLTEDEIAVLTLKGKGYQDHEIPGLLTISVRTMKSLLASAFAACGLHRAAGVVAIAYLQETE